MTRQGIIRRSKELLPVDRSGNANKMVQRDSRVIIPVKVYPRAEWNQKPVRTVDDEVRYFKVETAELRIEVRALRDKIKRMEAMLIDELLMWKHGLDHQEWETYEAVKRRMSRLQGAIDYIGRANSATIDTTLPIEYER